MESEKSEKKDTGLKISGQKLAVVICILLTELCERLTYYSVLANLVLFCTTTLEMTSSQASSVSLVFSGTVFIIPVFGGFVADSMAGKYNTILGSGFLYVLGLVLLPASAADYSRWFGEDANGGFYDITVGLRKIYFYMALVFIALGTGGIKANVGPFGAQQVDDLGPEAVQTFFNWFYWFINAGAFVAYLGVAYIQQNISFEIGFLIPLISMIIALIIFVAAKKRYVMARPGGLSDDLFGVCCATKCKGFDAAREKNGGKYTDESVDGVIALLRVLPVFILFIFYWAIYSQMQTTFFLQSERMNVQLGSVKMPAAALNVFNTIIILILIPIVDRIIFPLMAKFGRSPTHLQRIGFGFVLASLSVFVAGVVEIYRKQELASSGGITQELAGDKFNASTLSMFIQVPEFALVGASEVFASISGLEFAYSQAPDFMHGRCMGLFLVMSGLGNYVSDAILRIVTAATGSDPPDAWFPDEINKGQTEKLFFLLGGLMIVDFLVFLLIAWQYKYRQHPTEKTKEELALEGPPTGNDNAAFIDEKPPPYDGIHHGFTQEPEVTKL